MKNETELRSIQQTCWLFIHSIVAYRFIPILILLYLFKVFMRNSFNRRQMPKPHYMKLTPLYIVSLQLVQNELIFVLSNCPGNGYSSSAVSQKPCEKFTGSKLTGAHSRFLHSPFEHVTNTCS